jgi:hypothetical protein
MHPTTYRRNPRRGALFFAVLVAVGQVFAATPPPPTPTPAPTPGVASTAGYLGLNSKVSANVVGVLPAGGPADNFTAGYANSFFDGDIAEVILYNRNLSAGERLIENNYLQNKYNLSGFTAPPATAPPTGLVSSAVTANSVTLSWSASSGTAGVIGYQVYSGNTLLASTTGTFYELTGLSNGASYNFTIVAVDSLGRISATSTPLGVTLTAGWPYSSDPYGDADGDGVPNYEDARPNDPAIGILKVTIIAPANGSSVQ